MENKNSVKVTSSKTVRRVSPKIKNEIKDENNKKKIIIVALILALLLAVVAYAKISKNDDESDTDKKESKEQIIEKIEEDDSKKEESVSDAATSSTTKATEEAVSVVNTVASKASDEVEVVETNNNVDNDDEENASSEKVYYAITFETNGGEKLDKQILTEDETTTNIVPKKDGWSFAGWYEDEGLDTEFTFGKKLTGDKTLYAKWVKFFKFMTMDGKEFGNTQSTLGKEVSLLSKDELGDFFDENDDSEIIWITEINNGKDEFDLNELKLGTILTDELLPKDSDTVELYLDTLKKFDLEFYESEDSQEPIHTERVTESRKVDFSKANKAIIEKYSSEENSFGWYYKKGEDRVNYGYGSIADTNITKLYLSDVYEVTYNDQEETEDGIVFKEIDKQEVVKDSKIGDVLEPTKKDSKTFDGWYIIDDNTHEVTDNKLTKDTVISKDMNVVSKYIEEVKPEENKENEQLNTEEPLTSEKEEEVVKEEKPLVEEKKTEEVLSETEEIVEVHDTEKVEKE